MRKGETPLKHAAPIGLVAGLVGGGFFLSTLTVRNNLCQIKFQPSVN